MIEPHGALEFPPDDAVLWRFMDFPKFVSLLDSRQLFFAHLSQMEDKYEGEMTKPFAEFQRDLLRREYPDDPEKQKRQFDDLNYAQRDSTCVSCWYMDPEESAGMWKAYVRSPEGVAVRTTFADMRRAFWTHNYVVAGVVKYIDFTKDDATQTNSFQLVCRKRKQFAYEKEMRLIWWTDSEMKPGQYEVLPKFEGAGRPIDVDLEALVQQIYISPSSPPWFVDLVRSVIRQYGLSCPVAPSTLSGRPTW
jgi:hypothetical protein